MRGPQSLWTSVRIYVFIAALIAAMTYFLHRFGLVFDLDNIVLLYLLPVLLSSVRWGLRPAYYAAVLGVLSFDLFFIPPVLSFSVADLRYLISFGVFLLVAGLTAGLAVKLKQQVHLAEQREAHTAILYALSKQLGAVSTIDDLSATIARQISASMGIEASIHLDDEAAASDGPLSYDVLLRSEDRGYGLIQFRRRSDEDGEFTIERRRLMDAVGGLAAGAVARIKLAEEAKIAHLTAESERLRAAVLDSVSHELRTPLAAIIGAATGLIESEQLLSSADRTELLYTIRDGALRMNRLVVNLLHMVRLESGMLRLNKTWCDIEDLLGIALSRVKEFQQRRSLRVHISEPAPLIVGDEILLEQMLANIVSNAFKYSPDGSDVALSVKTENDWLEIAVADNGIRLTDEEYDRIFEKFYRAGSTRHIPGTGLGLAICKGIAELHGGTITAGANASAGTTITVRLPLNGSPKQKRLRRP